MEDFDDGRWRTDDLTLAAYLLMSVELLGEEWNFNGYTWKCSWMFEDTDELADLVSEYIGGTVEANLKEYNTNVAHLKKRMIEQHRARRAEASSA